MPRPNSDLHNDEQEPYSKQPEVLSDQELPLQIWSDTLAPLLSSSPSQLPPPTSPPKRPTSTITAKTKRKQPSKSNHQSNRKSSRTKPLNLPPTSHALSGQHLSTAALLKLLPRRRTRTHPSIISIPSSDEDNDDELSHPPTKKPRTRNQALSTTSEAAGSTKKLSPVKRRRATAAAKKAAVVEGAGAKAPSTKTKGGGGDRGDGRIRIGAPEMEREARWAREVEKWELEFEEVTGSSSDPMMRDAR